MAVVHADYTVSCTDTENRKRLFYRSVHRGCKEMDMLLGGFARQYINSLDSRQLVEYEKIVDLDDELLYSYVVGREPVPPAIDESLIKLVAGILHGKSSEK